MIRLLLLLLFIVPQGTYFQFFASFFTFSVLIVPGPPWFPPPPLFLEIVSMVKDNQNLEGKFLKVTAGGANEDELKSLYESDSDED